MRRHDWEEVTDLEHKSDHGFHILARVRRCPNCNTYQQLDTLYDYGSYSARGGPKVRGYRWVPLAGRCYPPPYR